MENDNRQVINDLPSCEINRNSYEPAYMQLVYILRQQVASGLLRAGDRLPSESQICKQYKVSPMTVRRAINILSDQGIVDTAQGRGTFVRPIKLESATFQLSALQDIFTSTQATVTILEARILFADERVSQKLKLQDEKRVIYIRRSISLAGEPLLYHREYLIYDPYKYEFLNVTGSRSLNIETKDLVSSYMIRFRRSDVDQRNEWTNYTNWEYPEEPPQPLQITPISSIKTTGAFNIANQKNILIDIAFLLDGKYRENLTRGEMYKYAEAYTRNKNVFDELPEVYYYNFSLNGDITDIQPSGAINMNAFKRFTLEFNTINPPLADTPILDDICDDQGNIIGTRKTTWVLNKYNYDVAIFEERINKVIISGGMCGLLYAR